jgi:hypothetical protein
VDQRKIQNYFEFVESRRREYLELVKMNPSESLSKRKLNGEFQEFVRFTQIRLIDENFDMNKDYDPRELDEQKLKINMSISELTKMLIEPIIDEKPQVHKQKDWNESFFILSNVARNTEVGKKIEVKKSLGLLFATNINK